MKAFIILVASLFMVNSVAAQDLLVKRNGEQMRVKVLKITKKKVQFVRHGTELPVYTLPISDIDYIEYPMGDRDTFGRGDKTTVDTPTTKEQKSQELPKWHGPVPPLNNKTVEIVTPQTKEKESATYALGDIYNKDGITGIIIMLYDGGNHGLIMSLDEACLAWSTLHRKQLKKTGADDHFNGIANMQAIEKYIAENNLSWEAFPAFKWCRDKGEGWFLPSINELWSAGTMYLGGSRTSGSRRFRKNFNANITNAGGTPLNNLMFYHSSTEDKDARYAKYSHMNSEPPHIQSGYKADDLFVRAFYKF